MIESMNLHLIIYCSGYYVARCQAESLVIFLHEFLAVRQSQNATITSHSLCDEVCRVSFLRVVKNSWVELHKLHVFYLSLGTINHSYAVACGNGRIGSSSIDGSCATCCHKCYLRKECVNLSCLRIQHISSKAFYVGCASGNTNSQVMLSYDFNGKIALKHFDVLVSSHSFHQSSLNLRTCVVSMMKNTEFRVSTLAMQVECTILFLVEVHSPLHQVANSFRRLSDYLSHSLRVGDVVAGNHCVFNVFFKIVNQKVSY